MKFIFKIKTTCLFLVFVTISNYSLAQGSIVAYIVKQGIKSTVKYSTIQELKAATQIGGRTVPVLLFKENIDLTIDGIHVQEKDFFYFTPEYFDLLSSTDLTTRSLLEMQLEANRKYLNYINSIPYVGYRFLNTTQRRYFFIGIQPTDAKQDKLKIMTVQEFLKSQGYYTCSDKCKVDGIIGDKSIKAFDDFIADYGLNQSLILFRSVSAKEFKISFYQASDFSDYYQNLKSPCFPNELCLSNSSISLSIQCRQDVSSGVEFDFMNFKVASLSYSNHGAKKTFSLEKNTKKNTMLVCDFGVEICIGDDINSTLMICGTNVSREGIESLSFTNTTGVTYNLNLKKSQN